VQAQRHPASLVAGLGAAQLLAWGTLYYAIAVLGEPIGAELGLTSGHVFGAFAWSMLISGVLAPWAGRTLDRLGGRALLISSVIVGAAAFVILARVHSIMALMAAWSLAGLAMALGLYDTCFAAIGQVAPGSYRRTVTGVTLLAGFASSVSWPATHYLVRSVGWRPTCDVYAAVLLVCAPLYALVLPANGSPAKARSVQKVARIEPSAAVRKRAQLLAWAFAGTAIVGASLSAHLVGVLKTLQLPSDHAVWIAASIGVMQVAGRVLELLLGSRLHPVRLGFVTFVGLLIAMLLLVVVSILPSAVYAFALVYGIANGLSTIAKATLPIEMFGLDNVGAVLGSFSAPALITRAFAPFAFAVALGTLGAEGAVMGLVAVSLASSAAYVATTHATDRGAPSAWPRSSA
jgi:predicted MFS family arabinose efflux permease